MDLAGLTRHVNHHFQSEVDGHTRKYTLHVTRNVTAGAVLALAAAAAAGDGVGASPAVTYALLSPGNHPNHGFTQSCDQAEASLLTALAEARQAQARRAAAAAKSPSPRPSPLTGKLPLPPSAEAIEAAFAESDLEVYTLAKSLSSPAGAVVCGQGSPLFAAHERYSRMWAAQEAGRAALRAAAAAVVSSGAASGEDSAAVRAAGKSALVAAASDSTTVPTCQWQLLPGPPPLLLPSGSTVVPGVTSILLT